MRVCIIEIQRQKENDRIYFRLLISYEIVSRVGVSLYAPVRSATDGDKYARSRLNYSSIVSSDLPA